MQIPTMTYIEKQFPTALDMMEDLKSWEDRQELFRAFFAVRHRDYRLVHLEITDVRSDMKYYADDPQRFATYTKRLSELKEIKDKRKQLQKQFAPWYYTMVNDVCIQLKTQGEAYKIIDEANGYVSDDETLWKLCTDCNEEKPIIDFYNNLATKDGLMSKCKICSHQSTDDSRKNKKKRTNARQENTASINTVNKTAN